MHKIIIYCLLLIFSSIPAYAQTAKDILAKYYDAIRKIDNISYTAHNIDTFLQGEVWNKTGYCIMKRGESKSLGGFLFKGKRDDMPVINFFDGTNIYDINTLDKTYKKDSINIHTRTLTGSPGGQMILKEMLIELKDYNKIDLKETDSSYILTFEWGVNHEFQMRNRFKELHIFKDSYLPFYRYHYLESFGSKQVNISRLTNIVVNDPSFKDPFMNPKFLEEYEYTPDHIHKNNVHKLEDTVAPDFELYSLDSTFFHLSKARGKVILIDFWEIWCGPCIKSIPNLKALINKYPAEKFEVWSIVSDSLTFSKAFRFTEKREINYPVLFGNRQLAKEYYVSGVPVYVIVDPEGNISHAQMGFSAEIEQSLDIFFKL